MMAGLAVCILALAGFTQGLSGFGFGLISMALLPLLLPFKDALVVVALLNVPVCALTLYSIRQHLSWRRGAGLTLGSCLGVPLGFYALVELDPQVLLRTLGGILCVFACHELILARRFPLRLPAWTGFPVGLVSGGLGGAFNAGGPPAVAYVYSQPWSKQEIIAVLQVVFGTSAVLRLVLVGQSSLLHSRLATLALLALVPMLAAIALGGRLMRRVPLPQLKSAVFVCLFGLGLKYLFTA